MKKKTKKIIIPSLDGVKANLTTVKNMTFPICRPLHVVTNGPPQGKVKKFIDGKSIKKVIVVKKKLVNIVV